MSRDGTRPQQPSRRIAKLRHMVHFSTGDPAMRWHDEPLDVARQVEGLGHAWAKRIAI
jgi:hypothetical protein